MEHGESPGASRGVWAKGIRYCPQAFDSPGEASVHGNGSELGVCKGVKPVRGPLMVRGKDEDSTHNPDMNLFGN